ncbi:hypothetical protein SAMN02745148_01578 [Modicisalibacter ilicicola DSM 19980]|uniref:Uncharacterized protein n=1 Tax=Modicisalibacter ilicicola DSM 19980 TaxID=1121942 RepID=A0A1M4Y443_9GAMM|nr:hypothetical protein [Halomonas ilicicola]SHF00557.1 hypothetical protein SAMN02745148_01578 [Halomonas ilicicola DSM 19980]
MTSTYPDDEVQPVKPSVFERHLQTGIQVILVLLLGWSGLKLVTLGESSAVLRERLVYQGEQIERLRRDLRDWSNVYYTKSDADREIGSLKSSVESIKSSLSGLRDRITVIEGKSNDS